MHSGWCSTFSNSLYNVLLSRYFVHKRKSLRVVYHRATRFATRLIFQ